MSVTDRQTPEHSQLLEELKRLKAENKQLKTIVEQANKIVRNQRESYSHRLTDLALLFTMPDAVLQGKETVINVAEVRNVVGLGHNTMADYLAAKAQAGGIEYGYKTVKQDTDNGKTAYQNESTIKFNPASFTTSDTKAAEATLKQRDANKRSEKKRLEQLKQSFLKCAHCGSTDMSVVTISICNQCNATGQVDGSTPDLIEIYKAEDVRVFVDVPAPHATPEPEPAPSDEPPFEDIPFPDEPPFEDISPAGRHTKEHQQPTQPETYTDENGLVWEVF